jgi:hypothetical protein
MVEFATVQEMQAHYQAVRNRIGSGNPHIRRPAPEVAPEPPSSKPLPAIIQEALTLPPTPPEIDPTTVWDKNGNPLRPPRATASSRFEDEKPYEYPKIWLQELTDLVCEYTGIDRILIWCPRRTQEIVKARFLVWALAREFCHQHSLPSIGRFCGRDHTTILHGCREGKKLPAYPELARQVRAILDNRAKEPKS